VASLKSRQYESLTAYLFLVPTFVFLVVFVFYPVVDTIRNSFFEWSLLSIREKVFVGFTQYFEWFKDPVAPIIFRNIGFIFLSKAIAQVLVGLVIASFLQRIKLKIARIFRVIFFLPVVLSSIAVGMLWAFIFSPDVGLIPLVFQKLHFSRLAVGWLGDFDLALLAVIIVDFWKAVPIPMILTLAAMQNIPEELYEAARMDGGNHRQLFAHITLPLLQRMIGICVVLASIDTIKIFDIIESMTRGGPGHSTQSFATYMYFTAFREYDLGRGSVVGVIVFLLCFVVTFIEMRIFYQETTSGSQALRGAG
jgi:ABC-type sugar transport system permease subunit